MRTHSKELSPLAAWWPLALLLLTSCWAHGEYTILVATGSLLAVPKIYVHIDGGVFRSSRIMLGRITTRVLLLEYCYQERREDQLYIRRRRCHRIVSYNTSESNADGNVLATFFCVVSQMFIVYTKGAVKKQEIAVNLEYSNSGTNVRILTLDFSILVIKKIYFVQIRKM